MARDSVAREQVFAAAESLVARGEKPTSRAVREELGTGSMSTVLGHLRAWQARRDEPPAPRAELPPAMLNMLSEFVGREIAKARAEIEEALGEARTSIGDLLREAQARDEALDEAGAEIAALRDERERLEGRIVAREEDVARLTTERDKALREAEEARTETAKACLRLEGVPRLEAELDRLRETLSRESAAREAAERKAAVEEARRTAMEDALARARDGETRSAAAVERSEALLREAEARTASEVDARRVAETSLARLEGELAETRRELSDARRESEAETGSGNPDGEPTASVKPHARPARRASKTGR